MCLIIDKDKDYYRACKGFSINGISYKRLLGTNGGIKNSTIVFVSERHHVELSRRIDNGRDMNKEMVPAKLEAYKALTCSASVPVSLPRGILVVHDVETTFKADTIYLDDEIGDEPVMEIRKDTEIKMDASDGYGLMLPSLAQRWSDELGLGYMMSGCNTRFSFEKGMVFTFDFVDFAENVAHCSEVVDVWGNKVDIHDVELIFTESMLKLWDSYKSCDDYLNNCADNRYTIGIPKTCPERLENLRTLNYQFIQSYDLDDSDIEELVKPTVDEIHDIISNDWRKTVLYMKGTGLNERNAVHIDNKFIDAVMIDSRIASDPFVQSSVYKIIKNRINQAKVGVLNVHGNYSMVSGDPYSLMQSIFGMDVTGILKSGEIFNKYWADTDSDRLACFRAPMSTHENVRIVRVNRSDEAMYWYRYMNTCTILNSWDCITAALNGCDFDGDLVMLTDNKVLVEKHRELPTIMCVQRKAKKMIPTEEDTIRSNIASFGNEIGQTTNWITSMYEVQSKFDKDSREYKELEYRIRCGQLIQQNVIDKSKGIIAKSMPRTWHDKHAVNIIEDENTRRFYRSIVADRKPYFMVYIYPELMKQYNTYSSNTNKNALREFRMNVSELKNIANEELTDRQRDFLRYYDARLPVGYGECVMNKICWKVESEFDRCVSRSSCKSEFDYRIMKSDAEYTRSQYNSIKTLKEEYTRRLQDYAVFSKSEKLDKYNIAETADLITQQFKRECDEICPNQKALCNIVLDMCYSCGGTKRFAWDMCGEQIIDNLLQKNGNAIHYPEHDDFGDIEFLGERFSIKTIVIGGNNEYCNE